MPRSPGLTGLIIVMSLAIVGFAAFSSTNNATAQPESVDVAGLDVAVVGAVVAAPLAAGPSPAPAPPPAPSPAPRLDEAAEAPVGPASTTTTFAPSTTTTTTTTVPATTTTTTAPTTTAAPTTTEATTTTAAPTTTEATTTTEAPEDTAPASFPPEVEQWRGLVSGYFSGGRIDEALKIIQCESKGDPNATNPTSGAAGLFQFIPSTWNWVASEMGLADYASGAPYDPTMNTAAAAWLVQYSIAEDYHRGPWGHWTCRRVLS